MNVPKKMRRTSHLNVESSAALLFRSPLRLRIPGKGCATHRMYLARLSHRVDSPPVIRLDHVTKTYPKASRPSLDDVSVNIEKGEFVFFIGPSGSGKSTIIKLLLHEVGPNRGKVVVNERDVTSMRSWRIPAFRPQIGCVFQDFRLLPNRTAYENVAFALERIGNSNGVARRDV